MHHLSLPGSKEATHKTTPVRGHSSCRGEPEKEEIPSDDCKEAIINKNNIEILNKKLRKISEEKREDSDVLEPNIKVSQKEDNNDGRHQ